MNLGLETDVNNPNFAGAMNPDKLLHVEFYMFTPLDQHRSQMAGKRVYQTIHKVQVDEHGKEKIIDTGEPRRVPFIKIMKPGDNTSILDTEVTEEHKRRWPEEWLYFASQEGLIDIGQDVPGWKIEEWDHIKDDSETIRNLKYLRFYTVEQIAGASDTQVQRLGMGGGGLREAAKRALRAKIGADISKEIAAKDAEIAAVKEQMKQMQEAIFAMQNQKPVNPPPQPEARQKRKYTKRTKPEATA